MKKLTIILFILLFTVPVYSINLDLWCYVGVSFKITKAFTLNLTPDAFYNITDNSFTYWAATLSGKYKIHKNLSSALQYRYVNKSGIIENRPRLDLIPNFKIKTITISDRNRFEYRIFKTENKFRYRNLIKGSLSMGTSLKITPYLYDEMYISEGELVQNDIGFGVSSKAIGVTIGGIAVNKKDKNFTDIVIVLKYNYTFDFINN